ncbi:MAG: sugar transferase (PEP-CTERM system associated) [Planctomycetota bacterium]
MARNLALPTGEIDILARRGRRYCAVEVKARRDHPAPERCVTTKQLDRIERSLRRLEAQLRPRARELRIDVITVRWQRHDSYDPSTADLQHFPGYRSWTGTAGGIESSRKDHATRSRTPSYKTRSLRLTNPMVTLAQQMIPRRKLLLLFSETLLFVAVIMVGTSVPPVSTRSFLLFEPSTDLWRGLLTSLTIAIICQASLSYNALYDWKVSQNRASLANRLVHSYGYALVMIGFLALFAGSLFYLPGLADINGETWKLIVLVGIAFVLVFLYRHAFHWFFYKWRFGERVIVLGSSPEALGLSRMIQDNPMAGFELLGIIEEVGQPALETRDTDPPLIGTLECLHTKCRDEGISRVIVALKERRGKFPVEALLKCRMDGVIIEEKEAMYERLTGKLAVESMRPSYLIYGSGFTKAPLTLALKRVLDILASLIGVVLSIPICILTALAIKLTSRGPIFFLQERVGEDGETFRLIKFRTMRTDAEDKSGPVWAAKNDVRVTAVGRFMRLTRIDEIPQFLNILRGQMSFVGPRPERKHFVDQLKQDIPFYPLRHTVKPGLTGWAQVCHPYGASIEDAQEKLRYDLYYIKNMSLLFDVSIMLRTVAVIMRGSGAR